MWSKVCNSFCDVRLNKTTNIVYKFTKCGSLKSLKVFKFEHSRRLDKSFTSCLVVEKHCLIKKRRLRASFKFTFRTFMGLEPVQRSNKQSKWARRYINYLINVFRQSRGVKARHSYLLEPEVHLATRLASRRYSPLLLMYHNSYFGDCHHYFISYGNLLSKLLNSLKYCNQTMSLVKIWFNHWRLQLRHTKLCFT